MEIYMPSHREGLYSREKMEGKFGKYMIFSSAAFPWKRAVFYCLAGGKSCGQKLREKKVFCRKKKIL